MECFLTEHPKAESQVCQNLSNIGLKMALDVIENRLVNSLTANRKSRLEI